MAEFIPNFSFIIARFAAGMLLRRKRKRADDEMEYDGDDDDDDSPMELHLTPLHGITQLRPSYEYLGEIRTVNVDLMIVKGRPGCWS